MVAFHYPPATGSSGVQRALKFSRYLPEFGWEPVVLTARAAAYPQIGSDQLDEIPSQVPILRAFAFDTARHLSVRGRYPNFLAWPDRWVSWWVAAVFAGWRLIRRCSPQVLWSTYPIATAHLIGLSLHRLTGIPWIADFRDSMTEEGYPEDPGKRAIYRWIERRTVAQAAAAVFTAPGAVRMYEKRYPEIPAERYACILNGYDEENFSNVPNHAFGRPLVKDRPLVLVHSGVVYPSERDPSQLFAALAELRSGGLVTSDDLVVRLRASGHDGFLERLIDGAGVSELVCLAPPLGYSDALAEMIAADGLLILQASNCNHQIPAKVYEYLRAGRPILALTDPAGDTAGLLKRCGITTIAPLDSREQIKAALVNFLMLVRQRKAQLPNVDAVRRFSRRSQTEEVARLFEAVAARRG